MPAWLRWICAIVVALVGILLIWFAAQADSAWFLRHVQLLDAYEAPRPRTPLVVRSVSAALGAGLLVVARFVQSRWKGASPARLAVAFARVGLGVVLALGMTEVMLRRAESRDREERRLLHHRLGQPDPRYGWIFRPSTSVTVELAGRAIDLAFDGQGHRIRAAGETAAATQPSLVVVGESVAMGHELRWDETFFALAGRELGLAPVNLAVNAYAVEQAFLRLADDLPRLERPAAIVTVVMPVQLGRNLVENHPHVALAADGSPIVLPPAPSLVRQLKLGQLFFDRVPYRGEAEVRRSVALTRALLLRTAVLARERGAQPLFLMVSPGPDRALEEHPEAWLVGELFGAGDLPFALVDLGENERFYMHPNPAGAHKIASAVVRALRKAGLGGGN